MDSDLYGQEFQDKQLEEIRLGLEVGVDVSVYAKPEYSALQMEQLRLGLEENVDVSVYAQPKYSYETMKQIRFALHVQVDLFPYIQQGFFDQSLEEIRIALEEGLPIARWLFPDMYAQQIREIRLGLENGIDVEIYASTAYNWLQMKEIRKGLEEDLDVSYYAKPLMEHKQMQEVRFGLEAGLDVTSYCDLIFTTRDMRKKRLALLQEKEAADEESGTVSDSRKLESPEEQLSKSDMCVMLEDNGNKAYVYIQRKDQLRISEKGLLKGLKAQGVRAGIIQSQVDLIIKKQIFDRNVLIAEGQEPTQGKDGWYEFMVRTDGWGAPDILPDGSVDYTAIEAMESVEEGQVLAVYHPAEPGKPGTDVTGKEIPARKGVERHSLSGSGFSIDGDKVTYRARRSGRFQLIDNHRIEITDMVVLNEDVTGVSGRVDVNGTVYVRGSVRLGGHINATGDIIIEDNVEGGELVAGGSILVKRGCCSQGECSLEAGGEVAGKFFEGVSITAEGNISANYIMNCKISTMGKVIVSGNKGVLFGGKTHALKGVEAYNVGNSSNLLTVLDVGTNETYLDKLAELKIQKEKCAGELGLYEEGRRKIALRTETSNPEIEEMSRKIETAIKMKQEELKDIEKKIKKLADTVEKGTKTPITVLGTVYAGTLIMIDGSKHLLYHDVKKVSFRRKEKAVEMQQV